MSLDYRVIEIFTSEEAKFKGMPLFQSIVKKVSSFKIAARCIVSRGIAGCYENGEICTQGIEILSFNMPIKIEIILPVAELDRVLPEIQKMVTDGIVLVEKMNICCHITTKRLIPRHLRVYDAMTPNPKSLALKAMATEAACILLKESFHGIPIVDSSAKPVGIITQRDLIERGKLPLRPGLIASMDGSLHAEAISALSNKKVDEIMTKPVITVSSETNLADTVDLMLAHSLKRFPVIDKNGKLCGMLSRIDVFRIISKHSPEWRHLNENYINVANLKYVRDIMTREIHQVEPDTPVEEILSLINDSDIQRVAVVDKENRLIGIISDHSLLAAFSEHKTGLFEFLLGRFSWTELKNRHNALVDFAKAKTASDIMQKNLITVSENNLIDEAIRIMTEHGIKRLPVIDDKEKFCGMVSRDALLRVGLGPN